MISKALLGCRVKHRTKNEEGIIIGNSANSNGAMFLLILKPDRTLTDFKFSSIIINKEDYKKIIAEEKPEPIHERFEIIDL